MLKPIPTVTDKRIANRCTGWLYEELVVNTQCTAAIRLVMLTYKRPIPVHVHVSRKAVLTMYFKVTFS